MSAPYQRLAAVLRQRIADDTYQPGTRFPSRGAIAAEHGVSLAVARRAVTVLRQEGLLAGQPRSRLTVAYPPAVRTLTDPDAPWPYGSGEMHGPTRRRAIDDLAVRLQVELGTTVHMWRVDLLDPDLRPAMLVTTWRRSLRDRPHASYRCVADPRHTITAEEAAVLGLAVGTAATLLERTRYDTEGHAVETADLVLPADRWLVAL